MKPTPEEEVARLLKLGLNHYGLGDIEAAIVCWERVQRLDSENTAARDYLATAYEERDGGNDGLTPPPQARVAGDAPIDPQDDADTPRSWGFLDSVDIDLEADDAPDTLIGEALEAFQSGDLERAWAGLQEAARRQPERLDVRGYLGLVRAQRAREFVREIGDLSRTLTVAKDLEELKSLKLTPEEGFLLSRIDGKLSVEELISLSALGRVETLETVAKLLREGVVE
ncbi:MAG: hypothetical protein ACE5FG_07755 [Myxococcota bacterium]